MKPAIWRSNIISCYYSTDVIGIYRKQVMDLIDCIAFFHHLECIATKDNLITSASFNPKNPLASAPVCDVIYVRSTPETVITWREFEKIIVSIFDKPASDIYEGGFVCAMPRAVLTEYPYPKK